MEKTSYKKLSSILAQIDGAAFIADRYARLDSRSLYLSDDTGKDVLR